MSYIFLDESGDLGFDFKKKKTTKYFVISCIYVSDKKVLEKIVKKTHSELKKKYKRRVGVLHCVKESPTTRKRLLKRVNEKDCRIVSIILEKKKVYTKLQNEKQVLYNYVTNILLDRIYSKELVPKVNHIELIASKRETNKFLNINFESYLKNQVKDRHKMKLEISIKTPSEEKGLQIADFIAWSTFRKYEHKDDKYHKIFKDKIKGEKPIFS